MKKQLFAAAFLSIAMTQAAQAAPIVFNWQGTATQAITQYGVDIGAMVSGTVSYDPATATAFNIYNEGPPGGGIINWKGNPMFVTVDAGSLHEKIDVTSGEQLLRQRRRLRVLQYQQFAGLFQPATAGRHRQGLEQQGPAHHVTGSERLCN